MNYNASNKTNFYNDKSQYTDQKKNFPNALAGTQLHI